MLADFTRKIVDRNDLTEDESTQAFDIIMDGEQTVADIAAFLTAMRMKGESVDELVGAARVMRKHATKVEHNQSILMDTCGTGGDTVNTFNISTTVAFVVAAGGVPVGKHGNRAVSSKSGSADLLEALGANIGLTEDQVGQSIDEIGIGFMFAQKLHPAMKAVAPARKALGFRTIFNMVGPLTNPASATHQVIGVFDQSYLHKAARTACALGGTGLIVVHNANGIDEMAPVGENCLAVCENGHLETRAVTAEDCGLRECSLSDLEGGNAEDNAAITRQILSGGNGAKTDAVAMNSGLAFHVAGTVGSIREGVGLAKDLISEGKAAEKLEQFVDFTRSFGHA